MRSPARFVTQVSRNLPIFRAQAVGLSAIVLLCSLAASSQSCPLRVGDFELQSSRPDTNSFRCSNDVNTAGYTRCTLSCTYKRPVAREVNSFSIYFEYIAPSPMSRNFVGSRYMCKPGATDGQNRQDIQVLALPEYAQDSLKKRAVDEVINLVFRQLEPVAAKCPGPQPLPAPVPTDQDYVCPARYGQFVRVDGMSVTDNKGKCKKDAGGNTVCEVHCVYRNSSVQGFSTYRLLGSWTEGVAATSIPLFGCPGEGGPKDILRHARKNIFISGIPYASATSGDEILGGQRAVGAVVQPSERIPMLAIAEQMMARIEVSANDCPLSANWGCRSEAEALTKAQAQRAAIEWELKDVREHGVRLVEARSQLSRWNEVMIGLRDPNYSGSQAALVRQLLALDATVRNRLRQAYGLDANADAPTIARTMRDNASARVDYYLGAERRIAELTAAEAKVDQQIREKRSWLRANTCPGNFASGSCDLTGDWWLMRDDISLGQWRFRPGGEGYFRVEGFDKNVMGDASIKGLDVTLWTSGREFPAFMEVRLNDACSEGSGTFRYAASKKPYPLTIQRIERGDRTFIEGAAYQILYDGRSFPTTFQRQTFEGRPIDVFYFKILDRAGIQIFQADENGQTMPLLGRFVRVPAFDSTDQTNIEWHYVTWVQGVNGWVRESKRIDKFEVR